MKMKQFGLDETKLLNFHSIFQNVGRGGGSSEPPDRTPGSIRLDPPLHGSPAFFSVTKTDSSLAPIS